MKRKIFIIVQILAAIASFDAISAEISPSDFHKRLIQKSLKDENWMSWQTISDTHSPADFVRLKVTSDKKGVSFKSDELGRAPRGYDKSIELTCEEGKYDKYGKNYSIKGKKIESNKEYELTVTSIFKLIDDIEYAEEGGPHKFMVSFNDCKILDPAEAQEAQSLLVEQHNKNYGDLDRDHISAGVPPNNFNAITSKNNEQAETDDQLETAKKEIEEVKNKTQQKIEEIEQDAKRSIEKIQRSVESAPNDSQEQQKQGYRNKGGIISNLQNTMKSGPEKESSEKLFLANRNLIMAIKGSGIIVVFLMIVLAGIRAFRIFIINRRGASSGQIYSKMPSLDAIVIGSRNNKNKAAILFAVCAINTGMTYYMWGDQNNQQNALETENTRTHGEESDGLGAGNALTEDISKVNKMSNIRTKEALPIRAKEPVDNATRLCKPDILLQSIGINDYAKVLSVTHRSSFGGKQACSLSLLSDGCIKSFESRLTNYLRFLSSADRNDLLQNNITGSAFGQLNDTKTWPSLNYSINGDNKIEIDYTYPFKKEDDLLQFVRFLKTVCYLSSASDEEFKNALINTIKYNHVPEINNTPLPEKVASNSDACNNNLADLILNQLGLSQVYRVNKSYISAKFGGAFKCQINAVTKNCIAQFSERVESYEKSTIGDDKMILQLAFMKRGPNIGPLNFHNLKLTRPWKLNISYKLDGTAISELMVGDIINELGTRSFQDNIMVMNAACKINSLPDSEFGSEIMNIARRGVDMKYLRRN